MSLNDKMKQIADAIRDKTSDAALLSLTDMANAIAGIQTGGKSLPLTVVGGTTMPAAPEKNTLWVKTDVPIPAWTLHMSRPTGNGLTEGEVWIESSKDQLAELIATEGSSTLHIPLKCAYIGKQTITPDGEGIYNRFAEAQFFRNTWQPLWQGQLYENGYEWDLFTGGWKATAVQSVEGTSAAAGAPTISRGSTTITANQVTGKSGVFHTTNKIDLTDIDTITFYGTLTRGGTAQLNFCAGVWSSFGSHYSESAVRSTRMAATSDTSISVDVSGLTGSYYVGIGLSAASKAVLERIILE